MKRLLAFAAFATALTLLPPLGNAQEKTDDEKAGPKDNIAPKGFTLLFNGKDLEGWQGLIPLPQRAKLNPEQLKQKQKEANDKIAGHWTVKNGVIHYDGKNNNLQTVKDYGNFEMWVDWKIGKKGDSGIYVRGNPQIQIWDNPEGSGGLYNNQKNAKKPILFADNPVGSWNTFYIKMVGDKVTVILNGRLVADEVPLENYWDRKSPLPAVGPIELQHHGDPLWFKNIYIKELPN